MLSLAISNSGFKPNASLWQHWKHYRQLRGELKVNRDAIWEFRSQLMRHEILEHDLQRARNRRKQHSNGWQVSRSKVNLYYRQPLVENARALYGQYAQSDIPQLLRLSLEPVPNKLVFAAYGASIAVVVGTAIWVAAAKFNLGWIGGPLSLGLFYGGLVGMFKAQDMGLHYKFNSLDREHLQAWESIQSLVLSGQAQKPHL